VRVLADVSKRTSGTLDVLVNNAGSTSVGLVSGAVNDSLWTLRARSTLTVLCARM
jgi:NAD(P)-dependent dehydrogenase (short-subunit alcohol dehydrogenase family)